MVVEVDRLAEGAFREQATFIQHLDDPTHMRQVVGLQQLDDVLAVEGLLDLDLDLERVADPAAVVTTVAEVAGLAVIGPALGADDLVIVQVAREVGLLDVLRHQRFQKPGHLLHAADIAQLIAAVAKDQHPRVIKLDAGVHGRLVLLDAQAVLSVVLDHVDISR